MKFSPSEIAFYDEFVSTSWPSDVVSISNAVYTELLAGQSVGRRIIAGSNGYPVLSDAPAVTLDTLKAGLVTAAASKRWEVETGGITLSGGVRIATGKDDQDRITSVLVHAAAAGVESFDFKGLNGWETMTLGELQVVAGAVARHVQACFTAERAHCVAIGKLTTIAQAQSYSVSTGWPTS